jgi:hypothetical protein
MSKRKLGGDEESTRKSLQPSILSQVDPSVEPITRVKPVKKKVQIAAETPKTVQEFEVTDESREEKRLAAAPAKARAKAVRSRSNLQDARVRTHFFSMTDLDPSIQHDTKPRALQESLRFGEKQCEGTWSGNKCKCIFNKHDNCSNYYWTGGWYDDGWYDDKDNPVVLFNRARSGPRHYGNDNKQIYICPQHIDTLIQHTTDEQVDNSPEWTYIFANYMDEYEQLLSIGKGNSLKFAPPEVKSDKRIVLAAINGGLRTLDFVDASLKENYNFLRNAVNLRPDLLQGVHDHFKQNDIIALDAINKDVNAFVYVHEDLKNDITFIADCMKKPKFKKVSRYADWFKNYRHLLGLPEGWTAGKSRETGDTYYINKSIGASQHEYPEGTPKGWKIMVARDNGREYYVNEGLDIHLLKLPGPMFGPRPLATRRTRLSPRSSRNA